MLSFRFSLLFEKLKDYIEHCITESILREELIVEHFFFFLEEELQFCQKFLPTF